MRTISPALAACLLLAASPLAFSAEPASVPGSKVKFVKRQLDDKFRSEGVAAGDFNKDGKLDIAAGEVWFAAPDWKMRPLVAQPKEYDPKNYSQSFCNFTDDLNGDGWPDLVVVGFPGESTNWLENPQGGDGAWKRHLITRVTNNESPQYPLLTAGKQRSLLFAAPDGMAFAQPAKDPNAPWEMTVVSAKGAPGTQKFDHGLGAGDINGDGRIDILCTKGWWEAPASATSAGWVFHPADFGAPCSQMYVYDFNGDGLPDVLSASAHAFGVWWHQQLPGGKWQTQLIDKSFSQTHAVELADINGDGLPDLVTGKRWWAHAQGDPGGDGPAVLFWFELTRKDGKADWLPHQIDHDSGVGTQFQVVDINGDGLLDIITSNKKGTFYHQQARE